MDRHGGGKSTWESAFRKETNGGVQRDSTGLAADPSGAQDVPKSWPSALDESRCSNQVERSGRTGKRLRLPLRTAKRAGTTWSPKDAAGSGHVSGKLAGKVPVTVKIRVFLEQFSLGCAQKTVFSLPIRASVMAPVRQKWLETRGEPRLGKPRLGKPRLGKPRLGKPRLGKPRLGKPRQGK
eukprot:gene25903-biopygen22522